MLHRRLLRLLNVLLLGLAFSGGNARAAEIYSKDPAHLWNRLYDATLVRTNAGVAYDDLLDPPYWFRTKYLLDGNQNRRVIQLLAEFTADSELSAHMTARQKAIMQRDLLSIFTWLVSKNEWTKSSRALATALARAVQSIALDGTSIKTLPDNYSAAVGTGRYATSYDPAKPEKPFLPKDLFEKDGPWLPLTTVDNDMLPATLHFQAFKGRSAFVVYFRHPDGRKAGEEYLLRLARASNRVASLVDDAQGEHGMTTEQFPPNTIWALVRQAILLDRDSKPVVSPIVESLQMRVYRSTEKYPSQYLDRNGNIQHTSPPSQFFYEWQLERKSLLADGGFHSTQPGEDEWQHFMGLGEDPFENEGSTLRPSKPPPTLSCFTCHTQAGIHSVNSRTRFFEEPNSRPVELKIANLRELASIAEFRSSEMANWQLLRWIIAEHSGN